MVIAPLDASFADVLKQPRSAFVEPIDRGIRVTQTGGAYVGAELDVPITPYDLTQGEPAIETFVCGPGEPVVAMGDDDQLKELWSGFAQVVADQVYEALERFGVQLEGPGYLTASALPLPSVSHDPHFDDDLFVPNDGVSIVATVSTHGGTRCTTDSIEFPTTSPGAPITVTQDLKDRFDSGQLTWVEGAQQRLLILPQFAQLHSGPNLEHGQESELRTLYVFRCRTTGVSAAPQRRRRGR